MASPCFLGQHLPFEGSLRFGVQTGIGVTDALELLGRNQLCTQEQTESLKAARDALEAVACLLEQPLQDPRSVVAIGDVIAKRGEAIRLAALLHLGELLELKL